MAKLIIKGREISCQYFGNNPDSIVVPYTRAQLDWLLQTNEERPIACSSFLGTIDNHYPSDPLLQFARIHPFVFPKLTALQPIREAPLVFTDGSPNGVATYVVDGKATSCLSPYSSAQLVELEAVIQVFQLFHS